MSREKNNQLQGEEIINQLVQQGVRHFCIAPGSRSTPLVLAIDRQPLVESYVHFDERGLGFFALGLAKAIQLPIVIVVTSGTALANLFPAVIEAYQSNTPLIILSADRPVHLHEVQANQAIDQIKLFGSFTRYFCHLPAEVDSMGKQYISTIVSNAVYSSMSSMGPVHINIAFNEPFYFKDPEINYIKPSRLKMHYSRLLLDEEVISYYEELVNFEEHGLIVACNVDETSVQAIEQLSKKLKWPMIAEPSSSAHLHCQEFVSFYEQTLKMIGKSIKLQPKTVFVFGDRFISKDLMNWLDETKPKHLIHISPTFHFNNPLHFATHRLHCDIASFCRSIANKITEREESRYYNTWNDLSSHSPKKHSNERKLLDHIFNHCDYQNIFIGNSMSIRHLTALYYPNIPIGQVYMNRGASGIDGNIATACGIGAATRKKIYCIIGDQTALHDLNSISLIKKTPGFQLIIINNQGGKIFNSLPIGQKEEICKKYFSADHNYNFESAAKMFDIPYFQPQSNNLEALLKSNDYAIIECDISHPNFNSQSSEKLIHAIS